MFQFVKLTGVVCAVLIAGAGMAQPAKPKTAKPVPKTAVAKKVDYEQMKKDIRSLYRDEKHKEVIAKATVYLAKYPKDTLITVQKAVSHAALKQYSTGFGLIKNFFSNTDTVAKYISLMAFSMPDEDLTTSGIACADEAIKIAPSNPWGYFVKGGIYSDKKDHDKALPLLEQMSSRLSTEVDEKMLGHFYAKELALSKQQEKALTVIEKMYKKFPGDEEIISTYAYIYRYNKQYKDAVVKYDELLKLAPDNINYNLWKAGALSESGDVAGACTVADNIIAKDDSYDFLRYRYKCPDYFAKPAIAEIKTAVWSVDFSGSNYEFTVSGIKGNADSDLEFDWAMNSSADMKGRITIPKAAMETAIAQTNRFSPADKATVLENRTTVWISKAVFAGLVTNGKAKMDVESGEEEFTVVPDTPEMRDEDIFETKVMVNGKEKYLNTLHVKNADGSRQLWILNDAKNPMIVKMQLDWSIVLKSIE